MSAKKKDEGSGPQYNIKGGIHAGRDVIMGDQTNKLVQQAEKSQSPEDFGKALQAIQKELVALKAQSGLTSAQSRNLEAAESKVKDAAEKAASEKPQANEIQTDLKEAQETMDLLSKGIGSAIRLGATLGNLALMALKIFGH